MQSRERIKSTVLLLQAAGFQTVLMDRNYKSLGVKDHRRADRRGARRVDTWVAGLSDVKLEALKSQLRELIKKRNEERAVGEKRDSLGWEV
jgi:hypothetical protein